MDNGQVIINSSQTGEGNIKINNKDLDKGILRIRYSNNRKLTNNLQKYDFLMLDKYNEHEFMKIRKNFDQIYIPK